MPSEHRIENLNCSNSVWCATHPKKTRTQKPCDWQKKKKEKEKVKDKKEREYFESLTPEQKVEYKRIKKRNKNLKKLGMYGLTAASMATGVGVPVMMVLKLRYTCASYVLSPNFCNECIVLSCKFTLPLFW